MRKEEEIINAINEIKNNTELTYGYRDDVEAVLSWVLNHTDEFDGLNEEKELT